MKQTVSIFRNISLVALSFAFSLLLASCSKNKDGDMAVKETIPFSGDYIVDDGSEVYTLTVIGKGNSSYQIKEFGGFLNVPLNATLDGSVLKIPSQTFTNPSGKSITIVGTGSLSTKSKKDDTIKFDYSVSGYTSYSGDFEGTRK